jgi:hypothetical protein
MNHAHGRGDGVAPRRVIRDVVRPCAGIRDGGHLDRLLVELGRRLPRGPDRRFR